MAGSAPGRIGEELPSIPVRQPNPIYVPDRRSVLVCGGDLPEPPPSLAIGDLRPTLLLRPGASAPDAAQRAIRSERVADGWRVVARPDVAPEGTTLAATIEPYADAILREAIRQRARLIVAIDDPRVAYPAAIAARWAGVPFVALAGALPAVGGWGADNPSLVAHARMEIRAAADLVAQADAPATLAGLARQADAAYSEADRAQPPARSLRETTIALIADEFSSEVFSPEARLLPLIPANWQAVIDQQRPAALIIESAWYGNEGAWRGKIFGGGNSPTSPIAEMTMRCRELGIPVIYWGKEDPPFRTNFLGVAACADVVCTTDAASIVPYRASGRVQARAVVSLPFAAQPALHHPVSAGAATDPTVAFGGTWWDRTYPGRAVFQAAVFEAVAPFGLAIYDRSARDKVSTRPFPERFAPFQRGGLPYRDMIEAYRRHPIHLNVNSVEGSPTMFARRVVEVLACGSVVLSGPGRGVTEVLGDVVPVLAAPGDAAPIVARWLADPVARLEDARRGWRAVYRAHLAGHRLALMLRVAGLRMMAPALPGFALHVDQVGPQVAATLLAQTILPAAVVTADPEAGALLPGVRVLGPGEALPPEVAWVGWLDEATAAGLAPEHYEDLLLTRAFDDADAVGMIDPEPGAPVRLVEAGAAIDAFGGLLRRDLADPAGMPPAISRFGLGMRRPVGAR